MKTSWDENPDWEKFGPLEVGDMVQLHVTSGFDYVVNVVVLKMESGEIKGRVQSVFDRGTRAHVCCGEVLSYLGKELVFPARLVQQVIKKVSRM